MLFHLTVWMFLDSLHVAGVVARVWPHMFCKHKWSYPWLANLLLTTVALVFFCICSDYNLLDEHFIWLSCVFKNLYLVFLVLAAGQDKLINSSAFCLKSCWWYLANLWFTFGRHVFWSVPKFFEGFSLSFLLAQAQLLKQTSSCLSIHSKMNEVCSLYDFFEYGPVAACNTALILLVHLRGLSRLRLILPF